jgi:hypothetical protein
LLTCLEFFEPSESEVTFAVENNSAVMRFKQLDRKKDVVLE